MGIVTGGVSYVLASKPYGVDIGFLCVVLMIVVLIGAGFLWAAAKLVERSFDVPFGKAYTTTIISLLSGIGVGFLLLGFALLMPDVLFLFVPFLAFPIGILVQAGVLSRRLSDTFRKALLMSLVIMALSIAFFAINVLIAIKVSPIVEYLNRHYGDLSGS